MSKNKRKLVKRLIEAEQYMAHIEERWFDDHLKNYKGEPKKITKYFV
ncbi:hypothetical protein MH076_04490 [Bacillus altitudinis]|nr:hypothetical protein [Bacillus altitudinis]MCY7701109.1 hypothetical protein [Bacillus altitudinis]